MANFLKNIIFCSFALFIASCGGAGGSSSGGGDADELNVILDLPILIGGKEISFTVTSASGASVPVGLTIIYDFERTNGRVSGLNPVSNQTYNPNSYSFTATDRSVTVLLDYGSGNVRNTYSCHLPVAVTTEPIGLARLSGVPKSQARGAITALSAEFVLILMNRHLPSSK